MKSPTAMKDGFDFTFEQSEKISSELARISSQVPCDFIYSMVKFVQEVTNY
ncbi:MAG: hypothetical protein PHR14_06180 [Oscillospiraceae bacterium]|nr:hypothetical protein [Oscillospiraceae bacterium]